MGTILRTLLMGLMLAVSTGIVRAGPYEDATIAYGQGDYASALRIWRQLAERGDKAAQTSVGMLYSQGQGAKQDLREAAKWFRLAAEQGDLMAQSMLGPMYEDGRGVLQDYKEAARWYRLAAEQGDAEAQGDLGNMYATGRGVTQDYVRAYMWFNLSASKLDDDRGKVAASAREKVANHLTAMQLNRAQEMTRQCEAKNFKNCD